MNTVYYVARYEDRAKIDKEAKALGWDEGVGPLMDMLDVNQYTTARKFNERSDAEKWLIERITAGKTFFGVGDLTELCTIKQLHRCRICTCDGKRRERSWHVDQDGRHDEHIFDDCFA